MTNKKLHVSTSPLTNRIFVGTVLKDGRTWSASKQDVTTDALVAVAEHTLAFGKPVVITNNGVPEFEITVKKFSAPEGDDHIGDANKMVKTPHVCAFSRSVLDGDTETCSCGAWR